MTAGNANYNISQEEIHLNGSEPVVLQQEEQGLTQRKKQLFLKKPHATTLQIPTEISAPLMSFASSF